MDSLTEKQKQQIKKAVEILRAGGVVAYPTDTAYGLAVDATNLEAVNKLFLVKGRKFNKAVSVIFSSLEQLGQVVEFNATAQKMVQKFFPGPITIVSPLKTTAKNWKMLAGDSDCLGFRMPDHAIVRHLISLLKRPITTTSANVSGRANTYTVAAIKNQFKSRKLKPNFYLNGGKLPKIKPSTVIKIIGTKVYLLREGPISFDQIKNTTKK